MLGCVYRLVGRSVGDNGNDVQASTQITDERWFICVIVQSISSVPNSFGSTIEQFTLLRSVPFGWSNWVSTWRFICFFFSCQITFSGAQAASIYNIIRNSIWMCIVMDWRRPSTSSCTLMISFRKCRFHFGSLALFLCLSLSLSLWCALFNRQHPNDWYFFPVDLWAQLHAEHSG